MRLIMTNGTDTAECVFSEDTDLKDCAKIRNNKRPVSKAFELAKKRFDIQSGMWPVQLEGLQQDKAA